MATMTFLSYDRENKRTSMSMNADDAILDATVQAVVDALDAVILGTAVRGSVTTTNLVDAGAAGPSAEAFANRGNKWLFRIQASAGADAGTIYQHELGTADNDQLPSATTDFLDLTAGVGLALKTAIDAAWESPIGSAGVLLSVQQVNRAEN